MSESLAFKVLDFIDISMRRIILILAVFFILVLTTGLGDNGYGERVGTVAKLSEKGWIWHTWEGEAIMGGLGNFGSYVFEFTVCDKDPQKIEEIQALMGKQVKIHYYSPFVYYRWTQKSKYCLEEIKAI